MADIQAAGQAHNLAFDYTGLSLDVIRPDDLLRLTFRLVNLKVQGGRLVRIDPGSPATVIVVLPPQHLAEASTPAGSVPSNPPLPSVVAGSSLLAFTVPDGVESLPLDLPTLLGWGSLVPVPPAHPAGTPGPPGGSFLELPYRMLLAVDSAQWQPSPAVFDRATGAAELWRTRAVRPSLHVTWSQDLPPPTRPRRWWSPPPGWSFPRLWGITPGADVATTLTADQRRQIARQAPALDVDSITLSALGATANLHASLPAGDVADWHHIMSLGRDSYVRIVSRGRLAPFGHQAVCAQVTERIPVAAATADATIPPAVLEGLVTTTRLVVISPSVDYTDAEATAAYLRAGAMMSVPLRNVLLPDLATPPVALPSPADVVRTGQGEPLIFHVVAEDLRGAPVKLSLPMVFLQDSQVGSAANFNGPGPGGFSVAPADLGGQNVAFVGAPGRVPPVPEPPDGSVLPVDTMSFTVFMTGGQIHPFLPRLKQAVVRVPSAGAVARGPAPQWHIRYQPAYLRGGFDPATNCSKVFAAVDDVPSPVLALGASSAGGLAAPALPIDGLSRDLGPVAGAQPPAGDGPGPLMTGQFDPTTLLAGLKDAVLLGGIKLSDILKPVPPAPTFDPSKVPAFKRERLTDPTDPTDRTDRIQTTFNWAPPMQSLTLPALTIDAGNATLSLSATVTAPLDGTESTSVIHGQLTGINLIFLGAVELDIDLLAFDAVSGSKVHLTTGRNLKIVFTGDLKFLNELANALPPDGFADPPYVDADAQGVTAGYTLGLPSIGVGIVSIQNIAFEAALSLPFTAPLGLRLAFSTREHPFLVSVSFLAGGGFFGIDVGADGVRRIEGALELGADASVDLAIVSAEMHVLAGFYFGRDATGTTFSAFLRIGGSVDLLGLISVSVELYLALAYSTDRSRIEGSGSLTLSVHVLFVTKCVTLSVKKHFDVPGGAAHVARLVGAPTPPSPVSFKNVMSPDDWALYLSAFA